MTRGQRFRCALAVVLVVHAVAACGSGDGRGRADPAPTTSAPASSSTEPSDAPSDWEYRDTPVHGAQTRDRGRPAQLEFWVGDDGASGAVLYDSTNLDVDLVGITCDPTCIGAGEVDGVPLDLMIRPTEPLDPHFAVENYQELFERLLDASELTVTITYDDGPVELVFPVRGLDPDRVPGFPRSSGADRSSGEDTERAGTSFDAADAVGLPPEDGAACDDDGLLPREATRQGWEAAFEQFGCAAVGPGGHGFDVWEDGGASSVRWWFGEETERTSLCFDGSKPPVDPETVAMAAFDPGELDPSATFASLEVATYATPDEASEQFAWVADRFNDQCGLGTTTTAGILRNDQGEEYGDAFEELWVLQDQTSHRGYAVLMVRAGSRLARVEVHGEKAVAYVGPAAVIAGRALTGS